jgi:hypothetical protein
MLPASVRQAITDAIQQAPVTPDLVQGTPQPTPTTGAPIGTTSTVPQTTQVATTTQAPTTTLAPTTTQVSTTTTVPPEVSDSSGQGGNNDDSGQGSSGQTATTLP